MTEVVFSLSPINGQTPPDRAKRATGAGRGTPDQATLRETLITAWNEYFYAFVFMTDVQDYTLPVRLGSFRTSFGTDWGATLAASTLVTLPFLLFFLVVQERMVGGLTAGAVKG